MAHCYFPCHKLRLFLQEMFCQPSQPGAANTVVYLKDVPAAHLELLLTFCYRGQVEVAQAELPSFLHTAAGLQVRGLSGEPGQEPVQGAGLVVGQENNVVPQRRKQTRVAAPPPQSGEGRAGQEAGQVAIKQENEEELEPVQPVAQHLLTSKQEENGGEELSDDLSDYSTNVMFEEENNSMEAFTMPEPAV